MVNPSQQQARCVLRFLLCSKASSLRVFVALKLLSRYPIVTFSPFYGGVSFVKLNIKKKGALIIRGVTGKPSCYPIAPTKKRANCAGARGGYVGKYKRGILGHQEFRL